MEETRLYEMQATLINETEEFYIKCYIAKDLKQEEREEYQAQVKKAMELAEKEENKGICLCG